MSYKLIETTRSVCMAISVAHNTVARQRSTSYGEPPADIEHFISESRRPIFVIRPFAVKERVKITREANIPILINGDLEYKYFLCVSEN